MSKKTDTPQAQEQAAQQPAHVVELLDKGTVTLQAKTREELADQIDNIPAEVRYAAGAIGKNPTTGLYQLRLDIIK